MDTHDIIAAAGGPTAIGRKLGISHSSVAEWRKTGRIPVGHVLKLEEITGISRHQLRPDIYGPLVSQPDAVSSAAPDAATQEEELTYGSTEWLVARAKARPPLRMSSVELLNSLHDERQDDEE